MAKTVVALEATINSSGAEGSVKSLRAQLKEAQADVAALSDKFGATSTEAINAAKRAAELKDKIGDAKNLTDAFNPDAKFKAFSSALQGVVGGFSALQGAQALFGSQSEELTKTLAKVQGAMALSQGLNTVLEAKDAFVNLGSVLKGNVISAFNGLKAAIGSTGIGLLVIAIPILIANFEKIKQVVANLFPGLAKLGGFIMDLIQNITDFVGITSEAQRATDKLIASNKKQIEETDRFLKYNADKYDEYTVRKIKANNEFKKNQNEILENDKLNEKQKQEYIKQARELAQREIEKADNDRISKQKEVNDKIAKDAKDANDKIIAENKRKNDEILAANKSLQEQRRQIEEDIFLKNIKDEDERAKKKLEFDYLRQKQSIEQSKASETEKNATLQDLYLQFVTDNQALEQQIRDKKNKDKVDDVDDAIQQMERQQEADIAYAEYQKKLDEEVANNKIAQAQRGVALLSNISDLVGKETAAGKATAIAAATIDTYQSAWSAFKNAQKNPISVLGPAYPYIQAGLAVAGGIANIKKIMSVQIPGKGGGGGSVPSGGMNVPSAPVAPQTATTTINQGQVNQLASATARAFVLESDVSGNQERIQRLNRAARIS
jgi:hypothetical protein